MELYCYAIRSNTNDTSSGKKDMINNIEIHQLNLGPYQVNTYILACCQSKETIIIDPGGEEDKINHLLTKHHLKPRFIINTPGHPDHIESNAVISKKYNIPICLHELDASFYQIHSDMKLHDQENINVGTQELKIIHTPGHTPGSICLLIENHLFSGDTLFVGDAGRTDLPGGNLNTLIKSIEHKIIILPPETILYPGHDYGDTPTSTIAREIKENIYITDFIVR